jgi:hypothetical protein
VNSLSRMMMMSSSFSSMFALLFKKSFKNSVLVSAGIVRTMINGCSIFCA